MPSDTFAVWIEAAKWLDDNGFQLAADALTRHLRDALTPTTSEATAIGAGEERVMNYTCRSCCAATDNDSDVCDQCEEDASPKPDTNTSVDPGVEGVANGQQYAADFTTGADKAREIVSWIESGETRNRVYRLVRNAFNATINHPIARSGMGIGEVEQAARTAFALKAAQIDRDARLAELTDDEIDSIIDGVLSAAALSPQQDQSR
ncbi:MAG TPA: hypothetical protein VF638_00930 [Sphingomonas sp.]|jgi:hypothetical protein